MSLELYQKPELKMKNIPLNNQTLLMCEAALGRKSFYHFVKMTWHVVEPETEFKEGWHIKMMCDYAQAMYEGKIRNLMVNVPPRHAKSLICSVFLPAWVWTNLITAKFLYASYGQELAIKHSIMCRELIKSDFYQERWPLILSKDQDQKHYFRNGHNGLRASFGAGGAVTGQGGDWIIADDILKVQDANSDLIREGINDWYDNTFSNRAFNPKNFKRIILGQRVHSSDIFGHILENKKAEWEQLILPAYYEGKRYVSSIGLNDPRTIEGEPLWKEVYDKPELDNLTANMSDLAIAGQLQQRPSTIQGNIFKKEWFAKRFSTVSSINSRWQSWDTASSINDSSAYSVCVTGELDNSYKLHIIDVYRERLDFTDLTTVAEELANKWKFKLNRIIIENKSTGISLVYALKKSSISWVRDLIQPYNPGFDDKDKRCFQAALWCNLGMVLLPEPDESKPWLFDFEEELFNVPQGKYRDQSDAFSQLVIFLQSYLEAGHKVKGGS